jgi:hypothetical protein
MPEAPLNPPLGARWRGGLRSLVRRGLTVELLEPERHLKPLRIATHKLYSQIRLVSAAKRRSGEGPWPKQDH